MKKNSIKHTRVNAEVQREVTRIIREELSDPRIAVMTSVTDVEVATDLKTCKVYISVLGDDIQKSDTMTALDKSKGYIRKLLASGLNLRNTPELTFIADGSIEYGINMSGLIDEVIAKDEANGQNRI